MADDLGLDLGKKKKSKKVIKIDGDDAPVETGVEAVEDGLGELNLGAKKKKKTPKTAGEEVVEEKVPTLEIGIGAQNLIDAKGAWPDYTYEEALTLVYQVMKDKNPDFAGDKKKFAIKLPEVARAGSKKTAFSNFLEICRLMKRQRLRKLQILGSKTK